MERGGSRTLARSPAWKMTWSACRTFAYSRSREFHRTVASWERSRPRASDPSSPRDSRPPGLPCRQACLSKRPGAGTEDIGYVADTSISAAPDSDVRRACLFVEADLDGKGGGRAIGEHRGGPTG